LILKSKLGNSYPVADLSYLTGDVDGLDPVFAGRLAYVFKVESNKQGKVIKMTVTDGYRSLADQEKMYRDYKAGKLKATAAVPGTSWHGSRLAVDTSTQPIRRMTNAELKQYGLCKPLSNEGWHIQPIETAMMGVKSNTSLSPIDLSEQLKTKFGISDDTIEYIEAYVYASPLVEGLLSGKKTFSEETMNYLKAYKYWDSLKLKLGM
jgi:hypothetical protein